MYAPKGTALKVILVIRTLNASTFLSESFQELLDRPL